MLTDLADLKNLDIKRETKKKLKKIRKIKEQFIFLHRSPSLKGPEIAAPGTNENRVKRGPKTEGLGENLSIKQFDF